MSLVIAHDLRGNTATVRWRFYAPTRHDALLGHIGRDRHFRTSHPSLDALDNALWGDNVRDQIIRIMKEARDGDGPKAA